MGSTTADVQTRLRLVLSLADFSTRLLSLEDDQFMGLTLLMRLARHGSPNAREYIDAATQMQLAYAGESAVKHSSSRLDCGPLAASMSPLSLCLSVWSVCLFVCLSGAAFASLSLSVSVYICLSACLPLTTSRRLSVSFFPLLPHSFRLSVLSDLLQDRGQHGGPSDGLMYHGYNTASKAVSCCKWGRANGWIMMGHIEVGQGRGE